MLAIICLKCFTPALPLCDCSNVGAITDIDDHINIYVEDITTCRPADIGIHNGVEMTRDLLPPFDEALYASYKSIRDSHINFQPYTPKNNYVRKNPVKYDKELMRLLDRHKHSTASPGRFGSTKQQPNRKTHEN